MKFLKKILPYLIIFFLFATTVRAVTIFTVPQGGTGKGTFTAFAPVFGGTTTTNPLQSGTVGTSGQILTSNGAGALPTFQTLTVPPSITLETNGVLNSSQSVLNLFANGPIRVVDVGLGNIGFTCDTAGPSTDGCLSQTDWNTFNNKGSGTVTSVSGTANRITSTGGATPVIDISASYVGQSSITTLGTITTGVWSGTAIGTTKGGTGLTSYTTGDTLYASATNVLSKLAIGSTGQVLTVAGGVPTWAAPAAATSLPISGLTVAIATNTINNLDYSQEWDWNTLSSNSALTLASTSTAAASNTQTLLNIGLSGANATANQITYGLQVSNTHTGTNPTNVAAFFKATGANPIALQTGTGTVQLGYAAGSAPGGTAWELQVNGSVTVEFGNSYNIQSYGTSYGGQFINLYSSSWRIGINSYQNDLLFINGVNNRSDLIATQAGQLSVHGNGGTVNAYLDVIGTTEQMRLKYDASNYFSTTVGSTGGVTLDAVGSGANFTLSDGVSLTSTINKYNNISTVGWGVPAIYGNLRSVGATAAVSPVTTYTVGASDGSFLVSANILVTTSVAHSFTATVTYTDEGSTSRTVTLQFSNLAGAFVTLIANAAGTVPYEGVPLHIRAKAGTSITIATTGTFTSVVYNVEGLIQQVS